MRTNGRRRGEKCKNWLPREHEWNSNLIAWNVTKLDEENIFTKYIFWFDGWMTQCNETCVDGMATQQGIYYLHRRAWELLPYDHHHHLLRRPHYHCHSHSFNFSLSFRSVCLPAGQTANLWSSYVHCMQTFRGALLPPLKIETLIPAAIISMMTIHQPTTNPMCAIIHSFASNVLFCFWIWRNFVFKKFQARRTHHLGTGCVCFLSEKAKQNADFCATPPFI